MVISLSFADIKGATSEKAIEGIKYALAKLYETHEYVKNGNNMGRREQEFFDSVSSDMPDTVAVLALKYLSDYLSRYYGQKVLIFLDEYDTPLQEAYVQGYWEEMVQFIRRYRLTSNRESGFGRYDVMLTPCRRGEPAYVLEFKVHDPEDEAALEDTVQEALRQIQEKQYDSELTAQGIPREQIRHYGFAFEGKRVLIG